MKQCSSGNRRSGGPQEKVCGSTDATTAGQQKVGQVRFASDHGHGCPDSQSALPPLCRGAPALGHPRADLSKPQAISSARGEPRTLLVLDEAETGPLPLGDNSALCARFALAFGFWCRRRGSTQGHPNVPSTQVRDNAAAAGRDAP